MSPDFLLHAISTVIAIIVVMVPGVFAYGSLTRQVKNNADSIEKNCNDIEKIERRQQEHHENDTRHYTSTDRARDQEYRQDMKAKLTQIDAKIDQITQLMGQMGASLMRPPRQD